MENLHRYILGASGSGKSTLLKSWVLQELDAPVLFIDPLGPNALDLLDHLPPDTTTRVCYIDLGNREHSVGFNPVEEPQHLVEAFKGIWRDSWGPRLEWFLYNGLAALHEARGTLLDLPALYYDDEHRARILKRAMKPSTLEFWLREYPSYNDRYREDAMGPILNKVGQFLASPAIRASLSVKSPPLSLPKALRAKTIIILNLNIPVVGEQAGHLYASMFISRLRTALMQTPTLIRLYFDEFPKYAAHHIPDLTSIFRNFGVSLTASHQLLEQIEPATRASILTNMTSKTVFQSSPEDARIIAPHFKTNLQDFTRELTDLAPYSAWQHDRNGNKRITTTPLPEQRSHRATIIKESNDRFAHAIVPPAPRRQVFKQPARRIVRRRRT